jgi:Tfp pilus assembly protein FimT
MVVIALAGLLAGLVVPNVVSSLNQEPVRKATRLLAMALNQGRNEALTSGALHALVLDLDTSRFWIERLEQDPLQGRDNAPLSGFDQRGAALPGGLRFAQVAFQDREAVIQGQVEVRIQAQGLAEPALVGLVDDAGRTTSLRVEPFETAPRIYRGLPGFETLETAEEL